MYAGEKLATEVDVKSRQHDWQRMAKIGASVLVSTGALFLAGCKSEADTVSENLSTAADNFEIERRILFINGITDQVPLVIEGRCSIEADEADGQLEVTCKTGPDAYKKHFLGLSDNMSYIVEQQAPADVDEYRTRIIIKPEQLLPNFDLNTSGGN